MESTDDRDDCYRIYMALHENMSVTVLNDCQINYFQSGYCVKFDIWLFYVVHYNNIVMYNTVEQ